MEGILALSAGYSVEVAWFTAFVSTYGPSILVGAVSRAFGLVHKGGKRLIGFIQTCRGTIAPGPLLNLSRGRLIPGTPGAPSSSVPRSQRSGILRENMLEASGHPRTYDVGINLQAHHIVPVELENHPVLRRIGMDMDDATNGILLPHDIHDDFTRSHIAYNNAIKEALDALDDPRLSDQFIQVKVYDMQLRIVEALFSESVTLTNRVPSNLDDWRKILGLI